MSGCLSFLCKQLCCFTEFSLIPVTSTCTNIRMCQKRFLGYVHKLGAVYFLIKESIIYMIVHVYIQSGPPKVSYFFMVPLTGGTFSPSYSSLFWFDPLLPQIQLTCLSLNCLYLFSPGYSSFRMVCTYSHPDTFIQLSYPFLMGSLIQVDNYVPLNFQIQKAKKYSQD